MHSAARPAIPPPSDESEVDSSNAFTFPGHPTNASVQSVRTKTDVHARKERRGSLRCAYQRREVLVQGYIAVLWEIPTTPVPSNSPNTELYIVLHLGQLKNSEIIARGIGEVLSMYVGVW